MSQTRTLDERPIAAILACLLGSMVLLGSSSDPPLVSISAVPSMDSGTTVKVRGVLVELRKYDSGAEALILADLNGGAVVRVISSPGIKQQPSEYVEVGYELLLEGEVSTAEASTVIFTGSDDVSVIRVAERVLTVESLTRNWILFDGDMIRVKGHLEQAGRGGEIRLRDLMGPCSIAVLPQGYDIAGCLGRNVTMTASLGFNIELGMLTLVASYISPVQ